VLYGGAEWRPQGDELCKGCDVLIATPGRLLDGMMRNKVGLDRVRYLPLKRQSNFSYLILDEADRMLDMGFEPEIRKILAYVTEDSKSIRRRQTNQSSPPNTHVQCNFSKSRPSSRKGFFSR
jgi:superfamily II DNA/RNA helicase